MKDDRLYLHHMLERCRRIARFIGPGREAFLVSEELQDAVIRNVEVIGEAAKRVAARIGSDCFEYLDAPDRRRGPLASVILGA